MTAKTAVVVIVAVAVERRWMTDIVAVSAGLLTQVLSPALACVIYLCIDQMYC